MPKKPEMQDQRRKAALIEIIGAGLFMVGLAMYFRPPGQEFFKLLITLPGLVRLDVAPASVMTIGALFWLFGKASRHEVDTKLTAQKLKYRRQFGLKRPDDEKQEILREIQKAVQNHYYSSWGYAGVLVLVVVAFITNLMDNGFIFKNALMFSMVWIVIAVKFKLHLTQRPRSVDEVQRGWNR